MLVSVEGNTYLSVPILGFGAENDEVGLGEERMPWLSAEHPVGDTSPLTRFVMGLDEALRHYRGSEESLLPLGHSSSHDPWNEDLFYRHLPVHSQVPGPETDSPRARGEPEAMRTDAHQDDRAAAPRFGDKPFEEPAGPGSSPDPWFVAGLKSVAGLLATMLLMPAFSRYFTREDDRAHLPPQAKPKRGDR